MSWPYKQSVIDMDSINGFINFKIKIHHTNFKIMSESCHEFRNCDLVGQMKDMQAILSDLFLNQNKPHPYIPSNASSTFNLNSGKKNKMALGFPGNCVLQ